MKQLTLSIVVPCYNEEAVIAKCLDAIAEQELAQMTQHSIRPSLTVPQLMWNNVATEVTKS